MNRARQHAQQRTAERRQRLALEAARLMAEHGIRDYALAKRKAADRLGVRDEAALPRNSEIEQALRDHQRLFHAGEQPERLQHLRKAAVEAMQALATFQPTLVGSVLDGTADRHSAVCLQLFSDAPETVAQHLTERGIPFETRSRLLRLDRERSFECPLLRLSADGVEFELCVLPVDGQRQPPLDPVDGKPMARANLVAVERLLLADQRADSAT